MRISVVIPCFNAASTLGYQLEALRKQSWHEAWEVIVADNGSTDTSIDVVRKYQQVMPNLRFVKATRRQGAAHARNVGVGAAEGELILFCDADDEVGDGWLAAMAKALEQHDFVASRWDVEKLNSPQVRKSRQNGQASGLQEYSYPPFLPHAASCGMGIRRVLHEMIGGFDEQMRYLQDTDYCWRLQLVGTSIHFVPDAVVHLRYREKLGDSYRQAKNYGEYNVLLYKKYREFGMPELSPSAGLKGWLKLLVNASHLFRPAARSRWVRQFGYRLGRVKGSFKHRILAL
jgi:GT2 family glycosyltransferase